MQTKNELFQSHLEPAPSGSGKLFEERFDAPSEPVICLGKTFASEEERRVYFTEELRKKLADPDFRKIEGFPIGKDEDILALSDPPYYTACPNPWIADFIAEWGKEKPISGGTYHREPFAADVSEGKNDPIYNAHSYHTKVPHKAIMRYILHYTDPGDIVFDGFCGTGMTGVAAQMCGNKEAVMSLGYQVQNDGTILQDDKPFSRLGARRAVLNDLSPAATFIAYNYNTPVDVAQFEKEAKRILQEVEDECGWMYETMHTDGKTKGKINYTVWSEVFSCPNCSKEIIYYDAAVGDDFSVNDIFSCPHCSAKLDKKSLNRQWDSYFDKSLQQNHKLVRYAPVLINYQINKNRYEKKPDNADLDRLRQIEETPIEDFFPNSEMPEGERKGKDGYHLKGITHLHHFYFHTSLLVYSRLWRKLEKYSPPFVKFFLQGHNLGFTKMNRYSAHHFSQVNRYFSGTLFVGSLISEVSPSYSMKHRLDRLLKLSLPGRYNDTIISTQSTTTIRKITDSSIDYIFIDPPFGNNLHYSELNFFWEAWIKILTSREPEAVMDKGRNRTLDDYRLLITSCFQELYRVLKSGHWTTIEFHNSSNRVWMAIQDALETAGFVVADVRTLDKQQETYKQSIQKLVKQDLVISAYKPNGGLENRFKLEAGTEEGVWDFVRIHLGQLPVLSYKDGEPELVSERLNYLLFDRMVAFHIRRGVFVPMSAGDFFLGLEQRFPIREGMYFLDDQAIEFDKKMRESKKPVEQSLFVNDEVSAIQWLKHQLSEKAQTKAEIHPKFMPELSGWNKKETVPELSTLLEQNFIKDDKDYWHVPDPENAAHIEQMREKALLKEFETYKTAVKKLKTFRIEAVRAGFKKSYIDHDYETIIKVADKLQGDAIEEDPKLLMYYSNAQTRLGKD
ncbi:DNA methylase [Spirochaetia bacterium]|nr:DNA methylase [Spirochaetia bacterium]